jgi:hypothetical protein
MEVTVLTGVQSENRRKIAHKRGYHEPKQMIGARLAISLGVRNG